jgi:hypothetical protein
MGRGKSARGKAQAEKAGAAQKAAPVDGLWHQESP